MPMLDYKDMSEIDLKLALLSGSDIKVGNIIISPYTLREIKDYGHSKYMTNIQWLSLTVDDFISSIPEEQSERKAILEEQRENLKAFDFYIKLGGNKFLAVLIEGLKMILKTDDIHIVDNNIMVDFFKKGIYIKDESGNTIVNKEVVECLKEDDITIVNRENFDTIIEVVKFQNYLDKPNNKGDEDFNPADEETRKLIEHMKKMRKKVEEKKRRQRSNEGNGDIDISDIVSAVSSRSNSINKINIWDLTIYQLYDEYSRLELIDDYDFSMKAMLAGAKKVELKHWSSKLD